jgi:hypothetical protein
MISKCSEGKLLTNEVIFKYPSLLNNCNADEKNEIEMK